MRIDKDVKVGLFVLFGLVLAALVVFLIGDERRIFSRSVELHTTFLDVQGLKAGSPVEMGGVRIGQVGRVAHGEDPEDTQVHVHLDIVREVMGRLRENHVVRIVGKGLLGDKMVVITPRTWDECDREPECRARHVPRPSFAECAERSACLERLVGEVTLEACWAQEACREGLAVSSLGECQARDGCRKGLATVQAWDACMASETCRRQLPYRRASAFPPLGDPLGADVTEIASVEPDDIMARVDAFAAEAESTMRVARGAIEEFHGVAADLRSDQLPSIDRTADSLAEVLDAVNHGTGYPARFLHDPDESERISRTIQNLDLLSVELRGTLAEVRGAVRQVRTGPGFAHDMLYGHGFRKEIGSFGEAANELALSLRGIREGDSFAHDVLYGGKTDGSDALRNVSLMTADLRDIVRDLKKGKGTLGALLVDPSIYEDLKRVIGNVERNNVLRALVRYSLKNDQAPPAATVTGTP